MAEPSSGARTVPLFPEKDPQDEIVPSNVRLTRRLWDRLERISELEDKSRNEVVAFFLEWACDDYERAKASKQHHHKK